MQRNIETKKINKTKREKYNVKRTRETQRPKKVKEHIQRKRLNIKRKREILKAKK